MLYTQEFYRLCKKRMTPKGLLSIHTDNYYLFPESFATIYKTVKSVFPYMATARVDMPCYGMGWTYRLAASSPISTKRMEANLKRLRARGHVLKHFSSCLFDAKPTLEEVEVMNPAGKDLDRQAAL
jgi:spermidine synthase